MFMQNVFKHTESRHILQMNQSILLDSFGICMPAESIV
jgi:hypothetical protein